MRFRAAIMTDLKTVVTRYRQRPPDHQDPGEADPLERWIKIVYFGFIEMFLDAKVTLCLMWC